jgi:Fic family protein
VYLHERHDWPQFRWDRSSVGDLLVAVRHRQGRLLGRMESLGFPLRAEAVLQTLTEDVLKSSEIEGEILNREQVRSSLARRLGMDVGAILPVDRDVEGVVEMMLDATQNYEVPLSVERLFGWHASLFPSGRSGLRPIRVGAWRDDAAGPMQVVSGPIGKERIHFQAPAAGRLDGEMITFLDWFNDPSPLDPVLKAALAHLWLVTLHPFDDGNGRISRALADLSLARSDQSPRRFYSMSAQIRIERHDYYTILERTQHGTLDITPWLTWFLGCLDRALLGSETTLHSVLRKARFWENLASIPLNERQRRLLNRLLDGFVGKLTSSKWAKLGECSQDTAYRDIMNLVALGVLHQEGNGRGTNYVLVEEERNPNP